MCTTAQGTVYKGSKHLKDSNNDQKINAKIGFETDMKMWKNNDFRCLKPTDIHNPEEWPHYEMHGYRAAKNKEELEKVKEIRFDKYFFNLEDPQVFMEMIKGENRENIWKMLQVFSSS